MNTLKKFQTYMGERRILFPLALIASGLSGLMSLVPFVFVWLIVRTLLGVGGTVASTPIGTYAWWAVGTAVAGLLIYFADDVALGGVPCRDQYASLGDA